ncbi:MAG: hypothetical protein K6F39_04935 [Lachnospiraceae bacterium]|nr:hypothetical protein [Lachnospiraceae bacterium]
MINNIGSIPDTASSTGTSMTEKIFRKEVDYTQLLKDHMEEMREKIANNDIEEKIPIGASSMSVKEWQKLMTAFDKAEETIHAEIKERSEKLALEKAKEQSENSVIDTNFLL